MGRALAGASLALAAWSFVIDPDEVAAEALWGWAGETAGDDLAEGPYLDVAKALAKRRPWHGEYPEARRRLAAIDAARSRSLVTGTGRPARP